MAADNRAIPTVLSIAGSDPSGGAGIQADLKTFMAAGVYGAAVLTALTAQNTLGVEGAMPVPADFVEQQLKSVLSDIPVDVIKLGMLPNSEVCGKIASHLPGYPVVCDPVMVSTSGHQLIDDAAVAALARQIIPVSDFITPNLSELEILYQGPVTDMEKAGRAIMEEFPDLRGAVLKGGHRQAKSGNTRDIFLFRQNGEVQCLAESHAYISTRNIHGTGCTFASAFAAFLASRHTPADAFVRAVHMTARLIELSAGQSIGAGHGPLLHHQYLHSQADQSS